jgi:hypothetical protein
MADSDDQDARAAEAPGGLSKEEKTLLRKGIHRAYQAAMASPPFYKGSSTDKLIDTMLSWGVDFSKVDLSQFASIRVED